MEEWKQWIDGYDVGIRYADDHIGMILEMLASQGVLDDTAIIVSSDHGENQGELNVYGDHQTADHHTCNIPLVIRWPGMASGVEQDGLCYNVDLAATVTEMAGGEIPQEWDGYSFAPAVGGDDWPGRRFLVISQGAWACQRSVRWGRALLMETHHDGFKMLEPLMLFDLKDDPHELNNLAETSGDLVRQGLSLLHGWESEMMRSSAHAEDPMWHVLREGGPHHTLPGHLTSYCEYLRRTDREHHAETLEKIHSGEHQRENPYVGTSPACRAG
jgi:arylsulfatase A-like enzyme